MRPWLGTKVAELDVGEEGTTEMRYAMFAPARRYLPHAVPRIRKNTSVYVQAGTQEASKQASSQGRKQPPLLRCCLAAACHACWDYVALQ